MTELERALVALGNELEYPPTPDLWPGVRERLHRRSWFRPAVFAVALGLVAVGIAFAVPPARSAILRFFHLGAATVEQVDTLPNAPSRPLVSGLGPRLSHATVELPSGLQATGYYARPGLAAALLRYDGKPVLFAKLDGDQMGLAKKFAGGETHVEPVQLGEFALWLTGGEHVLMWDSDQATTRLAGNVLLWLENGTTYRLEGELDKGQMVDLARQITR
jgi:hypothetical protein